MSLTTSQLMIPWGRLRIRNVCNGSVDRIGNTVHDAIKFSLNAISESVVSPILFNMPGWQRDGPAKKSARGLGLGREGKSQYTISNILHRKHVHVA